MKGDITDTEYNNVDRVQITVHRWEAFVSIYQRGELVQTIVFSADDFFRERDNIYVATREQYDHDLDKW